MERMEVRTHSAFIYELLGNTGYDNYIYAVISLVDIEGKYITYKEFDDEILNIIIALGFVQSGNIKYRYLKYDLNFQDNYIYNCWIKTIWTSQLNVFEMRFLIYSKL